MEPISVWAVLERATHAAEARRNPERWWAEGSISTDRLVSALATASKEPLANGPSLLTGSSPSALPLRWRDTPDEENQRLESRMRENRTYGSEGGEGFNSFPTPIERLGVR